ncbi:extracellular solute-binding protein [Clostridium carnis]
MGKRSKLLAVLIAGVLCATSLVGCGSKGDDEKASSNKKQTLTVWSHLTTNEVKEFETVAKAWGDANNFEVNVVEDKGKFQEMIQAAQSDNGPDLILGAPHDNLGTFQKAGITDEVPSGLVTADKYTSQGIVDSVTIGGKQYAVPLAQETSTLFYNKDKVKEVPKTMEELATKAKEVGFEYDVKNFYMSYAFLSAGGGYVYKNDNGTLKPDDIGLGNAGAKAGYEFIKKLVVDDKLMAADITGDIAKADFTSGKSAFYISGPWDVAASKEAGVNFGVVPMPTLGGKAPETFLGVQVAFVNANSKNKDAAWKLMEELVSKSSEIVYKAGNRIPVLKDAKVDDEYTKAFMEQAKVATPMPNIPEVQAMWEPAANNLKLLTAGQIDVDTCATNIVNQVKEGIAQLK